MRIQFTYVYLCLHIAGLNPILQLQGSNATRQQQQQQQQQQRGQDNSVTWSAPTVGDSPSQEKVKQSQAQQKLAEQQQQLLSQQPRSPESVGSSGGHQNHRPPSVGSGEGVSQAQQRPSSNLQSSNMPRFVYYPNMPIPEEWQILSYENQKKKQSKGDPISLPSSRGLKQVSSSEKNMSPHHLHSGQQQQQQQQRGQDNSVTRSAPTGKLLS